MGKNMNAVNLAASFYTLQALEILVYEDINSHSRTELYNDIQEYKAMFTEKLSNALYDYTAIVVYGEMRHAKIRSEYYYPSLPVSGSREYAYNKAYDYKPSSILNAGIELFDKYWENSYGGEKWKIIANQVSLKNKINDTIFCDMCFSLSHNGAPYLDKSDSNIFYISSISEYVDNLDFKFENINELQIIKRFNGYCGYFLKSFIKRAIVLGYIPKIPSLIRNLNTNSYENDITEINILNYEAKVWGNNCILDDLAESNNRYDEADEDEDEDIIRFNKAQVINNRNYPLNTIVKIINCDDIYNNFIKNGMQGKIVNYGHNINKLMIGIEFNKKIDGHSCGSCGKDGYCYFVSVKNIEIEKVIT
jgi:hypothetical protein